MSLEPSLTSRLVFTAIALVWALLRGRALLSATREATHRAERGAVERAPEHTRKLPLVYAATLAAALLEVWKAGEPIHPAMAAAGLGLLGFALSLRPGSHRLFASELPKKELLALHAELIGLPLLHGAAIAAAVGWLLSMAYRRGLTSALEREGRAS